MDTLERLLRVDRTLPVHKGGAPGPGVAGVPLTDGESRVEAFAVVGERLVFHSGDQVLNSAGTAQSTQVLISLTQGDKDVALYKTPSRVFVWTSAALWVTDGTLDGTIALLEGNFAWATSTPVTVGNNLFFKKPVGGPLSEAWVSDGTTGGTVALPLPVGSDRQTLPAHGRLYVTSAPPPSPGAAPCAIWRPRRHHERLAAGHWARGVRLHPVTQPPGQRQFGQAHNLSYR